MENSLRADVCGELRARVRVDHRADVGREQSRVADHELVHPSAKEAQHVLGRVLLEAEEAQRRAALTRAVERGLRGIAYDLLRQRRAVDDHRVHPARLRDQRRERAGTLRERAVDRLRRVDGAGEHDARDARIGQ